LLTDGSARYADVVRPYLDSDDITEDPGQKARRWAIDFNERSLEDAMKYPAALKVVRERVKPKRDASRNKALRQLWWLFDRPRPEMRKALEGYSRYIAGIRHGKRLLFAWCDPWTLAGDATNVFAFQDDYSIGILCSSTHRAWVVADPSTLEDRLRYTPTTAFRTFPWPYPVKDNQRESIGEIAQKIIERRQRACAENSFGLTTLYNAVDDGAYADLAKLHHDLDTEVIAAYGWPRSLVNDEDQIVQELLALNKGIAVGGRGYDPFAREKQSPGQLRLLD
jgi:hypothetical protein